MIRWIRRKIREREDRRRQAAEDWRWAVLHVWRPGEGFVPIDTSEITAERIDVSLFMPPKES